MKNLFFAVFFGLFLSSFLTLQAQAIQSGIFDFNKKDTYNYTLHENEGVRSVEVEINFEKPFDVKPKVILSLTKIDAAKDTRMRYSIESKSVSRDGFVVKVTVWGDTQLEGVGGYWLAHE